MPSGRGYRAAAIADGPIAHPQIGNSHNPDGFVWVFGGTHPSTSSPSPPQPVSNAVDRLDLRWEYWERGATPLPSEYCSDDQCHSCTAAMSDEEIAKLGGCKGSALDGHQYPARSGNYAFGAAVPLDGFVYVIAGTDRAHFDDSRTALYGGVVATGMMYDNRGYPFNGGETRGVPIPPFRATIYSDRDGTATQWHSGFGVTAHEHYIYIAGGGELTSSGVYWSVKHVARYDTVERKWEHSISGYSPAQGRVLKEMQYGREFPAMVGHGCHVYVMGGWHFGGRSAKSSVERYDPQANTWGSMADMNEPRVSHAAAAFGGRIYVSGGQSDIDGMQHLNTIEYYDIASNVWTKMDATMDLAVAGHAMVIMPKNLPYEKRSPYGRGELQCKRQRASTEPAECQCHNYDGTLNAATGGFCPALLSPAGRKCFFSFQNFPNNVQASGADANCCYSSMDSFRCQCSAGLNEGTVERICGDPSGQEC